MDNESNEPLDFAAEQARRMWLHGHSPALSERVFRLLGASVPLDVVYIAEHAEGDWDSARCSGRPLKVWTHQGCEFEEVGELGPLDSKNPIASRTPVIRYCVSKDGQRMIHNRWNGLRAGYGQILERVGETWESQGRSWLS